MNKRFYILPVMAVLLFFLSAIAFEKNAQAAEKKLLASGACGKMHYYYKSKDSYFYSFKADKSVRYRLYKDGTMVISGNGEMGDFDSWCEGSHTWYRRKELIPWYDYRDKIRKVIVEDGVETIGSAAFYKCKNLESVQWGDSILSVRDYSFYGCKKLKSIPWTEGIKGVGDSAFQKCTGLTEVRLPSHIEYWLRDVFSECTGLKKVYVEDGLQFPFEYPEYYGVGMFRDCTALKEIVLPKDLKVIPSYFVSGCTSLKTFRIPDNVIYWGSCPPSLCKGKYVLPDSVQRLSDGAFAGCSDLRCRCRCTARRVRSCQNGKIHSKAGRPC